MQPVQCHTGSLDLKPGKILWMEEPGRLQSMGSLRVGHDWSGPPSPPGDLSDLGIKPSSPALAGGFFTTEPTGKPNF